MKLLPIFAALTLVLFVQTSCKTHSSDSKPSKKDANAATALTEKTTPGTANSDDPNGSVNKPNTVLPIVVNVKSLSIFMKSRDDLDMATTANQPLDVSICIEGDIAFNRETFSIVSQAPASATLTVKILFHPNILVPSLTTSIERKDPTTYEIQRQSFPNRNGTYLTNFTVKKMDEIRVGIASRELTRKYFHDEIEQLKWPKPIVLFNAPCITDGVKIPISPLK